MSSWLGILLGIIVLVIIVFIVTSMKKKRSATSDEVVDPERTCKHCQGVLPNQYDKSLCPHCNGFLM
ncbi:hypothetical protein [Bacillus solitudinis]|uniref:hypothetical protein n=1 Tax=Bacillus solitudinis TaxID=2014074 RepID=UPI000C23DDE9|nr:hypothetical protein [Bacillus solitudinis]